MSKQSLDLWFGKKVKGNSMKLLQSILKFDNDFYSFDFRRIQIPSESCRVNLIKCTLETIQNQTKAWIKKGFRCIYWLKVKRYKSSQIVDVFWLSFTRRLQICVSHLDQPFQMTPQQDHPKNFIKELWRTSGQTSKKTSIT